MGTISIRNDDSQPFSAFDTALQVVRKSMDIAGGRATTIQLDNIGTHQSEAVCSILNIAYAMAMANDPKASRKLGGSGPIQTTELPGGVRRVSTPLGAHGDLKMSYDAPNKRTRIELPNYDEQALPASVMQQVIRNFHSLITGADMPRAQSGGKHYRIYSFPNKDNLAIGVQLISAIAHGQGFIREDDFHKVDGQLGQYGHALLLGEEAYNAITKHEKFNIPPPPPR